MNSRLLILGAVLAGCSVFEPPELTEGSGGAAGNGGVGGGSCAVEVGVIGDASMEGGNGAGGSGGAGGNMMSTDSGTGGLADSGTNGDAASDAASSGGSPPTGPFWRTVNDDGCEVAGLPSHDDRPATSDPGEDLPPIYLAQSKIRIGAVNDDQELSANPEAWREIGFDLDGVCTSSATCEVDQFLVSDKACKNSAVLPFDGKNCRDNEIGKVFNIAAASPFIGPYFGMSEADWSCEMHRGGFSIIYKISNYNGKLNDRNVRLDQYTSIGLKTLPSWKCRETIEAPLKEDWYQHAKWLPTSRWLITEQSIDLAAPDAGEELPNAKAADPSAYVRNGYLVARLPAGIDNWLNGERTAVPGFRLVSYRTTIVAKLEQQEDQTWEIEDGRVAYVSRPQDMIAGFREIGYCQNMCQSYDQLVGYLNTHQDALIGTDEVLPDTDCNGLTYGMDFEARQATAKAEDIVKGQDPVECPEPRHSDAPGQSCNCETGVGCGESADGGGP